jgi:hypothetical protein
MASIYKKPAHFDLVKDMGQKDQATQDLVIDNGFILLLSIAEWRDLLNSQLPVYDGDRQAPPNLSNLLPEGTDLDPDKWLTRHKSIPAFPRRNTSASSNRSSFWIQKILLEEFVDTYQIQWIWNSHLLTSNTRLIRSPWYSEKDPFDQTY